MNQNMMAAVNQGLNTKDGSSSDSQSVSFNRTGIFQNFIIRGCTQPHTLALSVKLTDREGFPPVQHFIIVQRGRKVHLEDSDLMFDNIVSLTFHYTQVW